MLNLKEITSSIKEKASREAREKGSPYSESDINRELSQSGSARKPDDIPKQDTQNRKGAKKNGNVGAFFPSTTRTGKSYCIGNPIRPNIFHDNGHADIQKQTPNLSDYWSLYKWRKMAEIAELTRPDLIDAIKAYNHFFDGNGTERRFSYERYIINDTSGQITLKNAILDAQYAAIQLWKSNKRPPQFKFTGPEIPCGSNDIYLSKTFPYPATENWQKTIGAHSIWLSGTVFTKSALGRDTDFKMKLTIHAEDQYNFNPGQSDIASGIKDDENGRFVIVGFAQGYRNTSSISRSFSWKGEKLGVASMGINLRRNTRPPKN